jgi:O-antigen/teichoic acid export membrane protein
VSANGKARREALLAAYDASSPAPPTNPIPLPGPVPTEGGDVSAPMQDGASPPPAAGGGSRGGLARRAGWNLIDQVLSAATNAALSFLVARAVDARGFGAFAVGFVIFTVLIGVGRALVGQPLNIRYSAATGAATHAAVARGMGTILLVTVPAGVLCVGAGLALGGILRPTLVAFGLVLPALIVQDACRLAFFARSRPQLATLNDALWAVVQFSAVAALVASGHASAWSLTLAWGGSALVCAVLGLFQLRVLPQLSGAASWLREHRDLVGYLVAQFLLGAGALQGGILLVGAFLGIGNLGSLRAAQVLTGPLGVLFSAAMTFGLPEVSRRATLSAGVRWRIAVGVTGAMLTSALLYTGILVLIPDALGVQLLGDTWSGASEVLLPVSLVSAFAGACLGPVIVILALGESKATFKLTAIEAVMVLTALLAGAGLGGAAGAAWGLCIQQAILVPLWFLQLRAILTRRP